MIQTQVYRQLSPVVIERAILKYLQVNSGWLPYHAVSYRVARSLSPTYKSDGTKESVLACMGSLRKAGIIARRRGRIGTRSWLRGKDRPLPDEVSLTNSDLPGSTGHVIEICESTLVSPYYGQTRPLASVRSGVLESHSPKSVRR
jgi:hypothetical protein